MSSFNEIQLNLQNIDLISTTKYSGLKILFVLNGEIRVETEGKFFHLKENDLFVINRNQLYQIKGLKKNIVISLKIPVSFISQYFPEYRLYRFRLFSPKINRGKEEIIRQLRKLLAELTIVFSRNEEGFRLEMNEIISNILLVLIRRFKEKETTSREIHDDDQRLKEIISYIEQFYDEPLTLDEVAQKFYLSPSYFSRYFKQRIGIGFTRFVMNVRLEHSVKDLLYTDQSIIYIALNNGFPNAKSFTNLFKEVYGVTPNTFREKNVQLQENLVKKYHLQESETFVSLPDILVKLNELMVEGDPTPINNTETSFEELPIDLTSSSDVNIQHPDNIIMIGELRELQKENVRTQILLAKDALKLKYIGIEKLLSGRTIQPNIETDELIPTTSPYYNSDEVLQFLQRNDIYLYIQMRFSRILQDPDGYLCKLESFMKHCLRVFGYNYVKHWCILFFETEETEIKSEEFQKIYLQFYSLIKRLIPSLKMGVWLPFSFKEGRLSERHEWILTEKNKIDFLGYDASPNEILDFKELDGAHFEMAKDFIREKTDKLKQYLKSKQIEKPLHLLRWNTISGMTRYTNGTFFRGALILEGAIQIGDQVKVLGFWINSEAHENSMKGKFPLEGIELFHYFNGKRPAFYAMAFFYRLKGKIIAMGTNFLMTENEIGYQLVLMNSTVTNPYLSIEENFMSKLIKEFKVTIKGIPSGEYQIRKFIFDKDNGALYKKWRENNSKYGIDKEVIDYITTSSQPSLEIIDEVISCEWSIYSYLTVNAIHFFEIRKVFL